MSDPLADPEPYTRVGKRLKEYRDRITELEIENERLKTEIFDLKQRAWGGRFA